MIGWWEQIPIRQRLAMFGLAIVLFVFGMQTWVWSSLDHSMMGLDQDITGLIQKKKELTKNIVLLQDIEQKVESLREELSLREQQFPDIVEPNGFRQDVVKIGKRRSVVIRLWNPQRSLVKTRESDLSPDIVVKVEGTFYDTVLFMNDVLQLPWVHSINPLILARKQGNRSVSMVMTDFTIKSFQSKKSQEANELVKA